jgi:hypothetical protein
MDMVKIRIILAASILLPSGQGEIIVAKWALSEVDTLLIYDWRTKIVDWLGGIHLPRSLMIKIHPYSEFLYS